MKLKLSKKTGVRIIKRISFFALIVFVSLFFYKESCAQELDEHETKEIVVVLDCSKSMENVDSQYLAVDFIKNLAAMLPRTYKMGIVAYKEDVCISLPLGSSYAMAENEFEELEYKHYGNVGAGIEEAVRLFQNEFTRKQIILISDGEIMMESTEKTEEVVKVFSEATDCAEEKGIEIDVIALGNHIEDGYTVYDAAEATGGQLYELENGERLSEFIEKNLLDEWNLNESHIGKLNGTSGELEVKLPDCYMETAKILLLGKQQNENLTVNCEAEKLNVLKGKNYTMIELTKPGSEDVKIQTFSETAMDIDAYLITEYDFEIITGHTYIPETQTADIWMEITNRYGKNLLDGHLKDGGMKVYLEDKERAYEVVDGKAVIEEKYQSDGSANLQISFEDVAGNYYGNTSVEEKIIVPVVEEEPEPIDWFFWLVITVFIIAITLIFYVAARRKKIWGSRKRVIDESRVPVNEKGIHKTDFCGKIQIYVIHNKEEIDYPPASINLFARCNKEMITLEWLLDACNLPLDVKGAERIIIKPGEDKSLMIKNNSKATALKGRELLIKGHSYHLYYHEKVTFIFDMEDTEIEVHYKDLKPNER